MSIRLKIDVALGERFKKIACLLAVLFLLAFVSQYATRKIDWRHELLFKLMFCAPPNWMQQQIEADLASLSATDLSPEKLKQAWQLDQGAHQLALYCIRNNQLETSYFPGPRDESRVQSMEKSFAEILATTIIPDLTCLISLADAADGCDFAVPVFVFARNDNLHERVILMPDFEALEGNEHWLKEVKKGSERYPWELKFPMAMWRGAMTGGLFTVDEFLKAPRSELVSLSLSHPEWVNAKYSLVCQCPEPERIQEVYANYFGEAIPVRGHIAYKYQILVDGNSCAYSRAYWQLFSQCLIFKQDSPHVQWYYRALKPQVHYIPVHRNFDNLLEQMQWAKEHDEEAKKMAKAARAFAEKNLRKSDIRRYLILLLRTYADIQSSSLSLFDVKGQALE